MGANSPPLSKDELARYLDRIGLEIRPAHDLAGLTQLHHAHLLSVPFENLDIHLGRKITLDPDAVFDKMVVRRRGGFCYEHNLLFARALSAIGFTVDILSSRVASGPRGWSPPFDHMTLRTTLERDYLVDVGFGDSYRDPLPFGGWSQDSGGATYRIQPREDGLLIERQTADPRMGRLYLTDPTPRRVDEFEAMCTVQQTSPDVWFTQTWTVTLPLSDGRLTLAPGSLTRTRAGIKRQTAVTSLQQATEILRTDFGMIGIELPDDFAFGSNAAE